MSIARAVEWWIPEASGTGDAHITVRDLHPYRQIEVRWACGETREFRADELAGLIDMLDLLVDRNVWLETYDSDENPFAVKIADGLLYGFDRVPALDPEGCLRFPWMALRGILIDLCHRGDEPDSERERDIETEADKAEAARESALVGAGRS